MFEGFKVVGVVWCGSAGNNKVIRWCGGGGSVQGGCGGVDNFYFGWLGCGQIVDRLGNEKTLAWALP